MLFEKGRALYLCCAGTHYGLLRYTTTFWAEEKTMAMKRNAIIGTIAAIAIMGTILATFGALISSRTVSNSTGVTAVGVGVFTDSACTSPLTSISWGMLNPGDAPTYTFYVQNNGTVSVTLTMTTGSWSPQAAAGNFTVAWNQQNSILAAGAVAQAVITLSVSSSAVGIASVTFVTIITGTH
jgi:hypothetical protein